MTNTVVVQRNMLRTLPSTSLQTRLRHLPYFDNADTHITTQHDDKSNTVTRNAYSTDVIHADTINLSPRLGITTSYTDTSFMIYSLFVPSISIQSFKDTGVYPLWTLYKNMIYSQQTTLSVEMLTTPINEYSKHYTEMMKRNVYECFYPIDPTTSSIISHQHSISTPSSLSSPYSLEVDRFHHLQDVPLLLLQFMTIRQFSRLNPTTSSSSSSHHTFVNTNNTNNNNDITSYFATFQKKYQFPLWMDEERPNKCGYHPEMFVLNEIPSHLICGFCKGICFKPVTICGCVNLCDGCVQESLNHINRISLFQCPKHSIGDKHQVQFNPRACLQINNLSIRCVYHSHGCSYQEQLHELHVRNYILHTGCQFEMIRCPYNCDTILHRIDLASHLTSHANSCYNTILNSCHTREPHAAYLWLLLHDFCAKLPTELFDQPTSSPHSSPPPTSLQFVLMDITYTSLLSPDTPVLPLLSHGPVHSLPMFAPTTFFFPAHSSSSEHKLMMTMSSTTEHLFVARIRWRDDFDCVSLFLHLCSIAPLFLPNLDEVYVLHSMICKHYDYYHKHLIDYYNEKLRNHPNSDHALKQIETLLNNIDKHPFTSFYPSDLYCLTFKKLIQKMPECKMSIETCIDLIYVVSVFKYALKLLNKVSTPGYAFSNPEQKLFYFPVVHNAIATYFPDISYDKIRKMNLCVSMEHLMLIILKSHIYVSITNNSASPGSIPDHMLSFTESSSPNPATTLPLPNATFYDTNVTSFIHTPNQQQSSCLVDIPKEYYNIPSRVQITSMNAHQPIVRARNYSVFVDNKPPPWHTLTKSAYYISTLLHIGSFLWGDATLRSKHSVSASLTCNPYLLGGVSRYHPFATIPRIYTWFHFVSKHKLCCFNHSQHLNDAKSPPPPPQSSPAATAPHTKVGDSTTFPQSFHAFEIEFPYLTWPLSHIVPRIIIVYHTSNDTWLVITFGLFVQNQIDTYVCHSFAIFCKWWSQTLVKIQAKRPFHNNNNNDRYIHIHSLIQSNLYQNYISTTQNNRQITSSLLRTTSTVQTLNKQLFYLLQQLKEQYIQHCSL